MSLTGRCHCGAIRFEASDKPMARVLCHCSDCRRHAGAPMVGWALFSETDVKLTRGSPKIYSSSENGRRHFCAACGTGLFYTNAAFLPGIIDVKIATFDDPETLPPECHMQTLERLAWMETAHDLPEFKQLPPME